MEPKLKVTTMRVDELVPYAHNAKLHPDEQVEQIANSIDQFGFNDPVGIWHDPDGNPIIVEGHGRVLAAKQLGIKSVPVVTLDHLDDEGRRAYTLAHNQTTMTSGFDMDVLSDELHGIENIDMSDFGFDGDAVAQIGQENDGTFSVDEDEFSEPEQIDSRVSRGQVWQLGEHRLMCGSSTDAGDVARLMGDERNAFLFTSPPYADMRDYNGDKDVSVDFLAQFIPTYAPYCEYQAVNLGIKRSNSEIVPYWNTYISAAHDADLKLMAWNVWDKGMCGSVGQQSALVPIRHEFVFMFAQHDFVFVFGEHDRRLNRTWEKLESSIDKRPVRAVRQADGSMKNSTRGDTSSPYKEMESVVRISPELNNSIRKSHPATFPVQLPSEYIAAFTPKGGTVAEPFCGSGTTIIACEQLGRKCYAMELDETYCEVAIQRWEQFTGNRAELVSE